MPTTGRPPDSGPVPEPVLSAARMNARFAVFQAWCPCASAPMLPPGAPLPGIDDHQCLLVRGRSVGRNSGRTGRRRRLAGTPDGAVRGHVCGNMAFDYVE